MARFPKNSDGLNVTLGYAGPGLVTALPAGSATGTPLAGTRPFHSESLRMYLRAGDKVEYFFAPTANSTPTAAPADTIILEGPLVFPEFFPPDLTIYFLPSTGTPKGRWM